MSEIKLNLRARRADLNTRGWKEKFFSTGSWRLTKALVREIKTKIGIRTARALVRSFQVSGICPTIERVSFSAVVIKY